MINIKGTEQELLMYSMDSISANLDEVDMGSAARLFNNKVVEEQIRRPQGQVDMLIGLHAAALFPTMEDSEQDVAGNLRLLSTKFGTGWLMDGQYLVVGPSRTLRALHFKIGTTKKARRKTRRSTDHAMSVRDKEFWKCRPQQCGCRHGQQDPLVWSHDAKQKGRLGAAVRHKIP